MRERVRPTQPQHQRQRQRDKAGQAPRGVRRGHERDGPDDPTRELRFDTFGRRYCVARECGTPMHVTARPMDHPIGGSARKSDNSFNRSKTPKRTSEAHIVLRGSQRRRPLSYHPRNEQNFCHHREGARSRGAGHARSQLHGGPSSMRATPISASRVTRLASCSSVRCSVP